MCDKCRSRSSRTTRGKHYSPPASRSPTPSRTPAVIVAPPATQQRQGSVFKDAAAVAGGVTVGTAAGHVAGQAISGLMSGGRRHEALPRDYEPGTEPSGPCAYEIGQFLNCASVSANIQECQAFSDALRECKHRNRIP